MELDLGVSGLASGFDWRALVDQLTDIERSPQRALLSEQNFLEQRNNAYGSLVTDIRVLENRITVLNDASLFDSRLVTVNDETIAIGSATTGAALGSYTFNITQLATASVQQGAADIGAGLSGTNDVSGLLLSEAAFATPVSGGSFTVNGSIVSIETSDTLQNVFEKISTATGGVVTGSYNSSTDKISLSSASTIVLGSAADTSNFLQVSKLYNNGTNTVSSLNSLGAIQTTSTLDSANFSTTISDGGSGAGEFKINGVSISFDVSADSLTSIITRINNSAAEVIASYDQINDRLRLTNKKTGDTGVALNDITGNFLAATGLSSGSLSRGNNLLYTINNGQQLVSESNTITETSSGISGLSVTALKEGSAILDVKSDIGKIKTAIQNFISAYNSVQSLLDSQTASTTDQDGKVTAGVLANDAEAASVASKLRSLSFSSVSGLSGALTRLEQLGYDTNGDNDNLTLKDPSALDNALANQLVDVKILFTSANIGIAAKISNYIDSLVDDDDGTLIDRQDRLTEQAGAINIQIEDLERIVQFRRQSLIDSFIAMEIAISQTNQQLEFLVARLGLGNSSTR